MIWFVLAMVTHPEKQSKCHEELDAAVGRSCTPTFKDQGSLPYVQATVREVLRWSIVAPFGQPSF